MMAMAFGALGCVSCGGGGSIAASSYNPGYGPFDKNGNYVEAWADKPAKKHWWARKPAAKPEDPPAETKTKKSPPVVAKTSPPEPSRAAAKPRRSSSRPGRYRPGPSRPTSVSSRQASAKPQPVASVPAPKPKPRPVASTPKPKPRPVASVAKPKPKPKPKPVKVTPKKPAPRKHLVKKGDTLYGLSRKYGTSVSSIQRANGLKGTTIQLGRTLKIPR